VNACRSLHQPERIESSASNTNVDERFLKAATWFNCKKTMNFVMSTQSAGRNQQTEVISKHHGLRNLFEEILSAAPCSGDQDITNLKRVTRLCVLEASCGCNSNKSRNSYIH
jgi:hypothetical protein